MKLRSGLVQVDSLFFQNINDISIVSSWKNLTDTCVVKLPRRYKSIMDKNKKSIVLDNVLKTGSEVDVKMGYNFDLKTRFKGFLKAVKPNYPVELEMEDQMYVWKRTKVAPKAFRGGNVADILQHLGIKDYKVMGIASIGDYAVIDGNTVARELERLKEVSGFPVFLRNGVVHFGGQYEPDVKKRTNHRFVIGFNVISHSLEYKLKEDNKVRVKVTSKLANGDNNSVEVGEHGDGVNFTTIQALPGITDDDILKKIAYEKIDKISYTGWRGKIVVFGEPIIQHGDTVELEDMDDGIIKGKYFVDTVEIKASTTSAYTQEVELGQIVK